jgi:hypothetical protein
MECISVFTQLLRSRSRCCQPHQTPPPPPPPPCSHEAVSAVGKVTPRNQYQKRHLRHVPNTPLSLVTGQRCSSQEQYRKLVLFAEFTRFHCRALLEHCNQQPRPPFPNPKVPNPTYKTLFLFSKPPLVPVSASHSTPQPPHHHLAPGADYRFRFYLCGPPPPRYQLAPPLHAAAPAADAAAAAAAAAAEEIMRCEYHDGFISHQPLPDKAVLRLRSLRATQQQQQQKC